MIAARFEFLPIYRGKYRRSRAQPVAGTGHTADADAFIIWDGRRPVARFPKSDVKEILARVVAAADGIKRQEHRKAS